MVNVYKRGGEGSRTDVVVGTFVNRAAAQRAIEELLHAGFRDDQIGVVTRDGDGNAISDDLGGMGTSGTGGAETTGALTGAAAGAGGGALWGLAVAAGVLPAIGPVIAGGVLTAIAVSAAAGAAAGSVLGALIGLGVPEEDARRYEQDFLAGRTIVTVRTETQREQAANILRRHGGGETSNTNLQDTDPMVRDEPITESRTTARRESSVPGESSVGGAKGASDPSDYSSRPRK